MNDLLMRLSRQQACRSRHVPLEERGWEFDPVRPVVGVSRRGLWRLRVAMLHVASFGLGKRRRDQFFDVGHFMFRALVRRQLLATLSAFTPSLNAGPSETTLMGARHP